MSEEISVRSSAAAKCWSEGEIRRVSDRLAIARHWIAKGCAVCPVVPDATTRFAIPVTHDADEFAEDGDWNPILPPTRRESDLYQYFVQAMPGAEVGLALGQLSNGLVAVILPEGILADDPSISRFLDALSLIRTVRFVRLSDKGKPTHVWLFRTPNPVENTMLTYGFGEHQGELQATGCIAAPGCSDEKGMAFLIDDYEILEFPQLVHDLAENGRMTV